jgi:molybdate transport system ATP-binding protein
MLSLECRMQRGTLHLDVELTAVPGATLVLIGENGAGKTTILDMIAGLVHPDTGRITLDGNVFFDNAQGIVTPAAARPVGYVFQDYALFPHLSVRENVAFGLRAQGVRRGTVRAHVDTMLERFGLTAHARARPDQLSGGQRQRVALARALILQPRVLLLDEPLAALDSRTRGHVRGELRDHLAALDCVTLLVTHDPFEALVFGERIAVVENGRVAQIGSRQELLQQPRSHYVAQLMGLNLLHGRVTGRDHTGLAEVTTANGTVHIVGAHDLTDVFVVIDPQEITLYASPPAGSAQNVFAGAILQIIPEPPFGDRVRVALDSRPPLVAEVTQRAVETLGLRAGVVVYASFKATAAHAYS